MKWTVGMKIGAGFGLASAIFLIVGVVSYRSTVKLTEAGDWVTHTHKVLEEPWGAGPGTDRCRDRAAGLHHHGDRILTWSPTGPACR